MKKRCHRMNPALIPIAIGHDSSVGEGMNPTVCPLPGPGHHSSVGEGMHLAVCPLVESMFIGSCLLKWNCGLSVKHRVRQLARGPAANTIIWEE